jgi:hypothetical protein
MWKAVQIRVEKVIPIEIYVERLGEFSEKIIIEIQVFVIISLIFNHKH